MGVDSEVKLDNWAEMSAMSRRFEQSKSPGTKVVLRVFGPAAMVNGLTMRSK